MMSVVSSIFSIRGLVYIVYGDNVFCYLEIDWFVVVLHGYLYGVYGVQVRRLVFRVRVLGRCSVF